MKEEKKKQIRDIMGDLKHLDKESLTLLRDNANLLRRRQLEFSVCLSYGDLSDVADVDKTATEAKIAKKRKFNMVAAIQSNLKDCLEDLVYALAFYNAMLRSGYEFSCTFKDSILEDEATERENDRADVALGAMQLWEYRMKHYAEDEETAKKMVAQTADVIE